MRHIEKNEIIGVAAGILIVVGLFGVGRLFPSFAPSEWGKGDDTVNETADIINISEAGTDNLLPALADAFSYSGEITKLIVEDTVVGEGAEAREGSIVTVHYIAALQSGLQFDNSFDRGAPYTFTVGAGDVIEGWEKGIVGMKEGGKRILVVPASMGYGNRTVGPVPPNSALLFAVELVEVR